MKPGLPSSIALHAAVLGWALLSFANSAPMELPPANDPIDVELLPPSNTSQPKLGNKTAKPSEQITPKDVKATAKEQDGKRVGEAKVEEPPPPPPEVKPTPTPPVEQKPAPVAEAKPEPVPPPPKPEVKPEPPKPVVKAEPVPPPPTPQVKPDLPKEAEKAKDVNEGKPPEVKEPPKDQKALDKLLAEKTKEEPKKEEPKKPEPKPAEKPAEKPVKVATATPSAPSKPTQSTSKLTGEVSAIQNHVQTGALQSKTEQHATLGTPTGPNANVKLSQSEMEALIAQLRAQILKCWSPPMGAAEANVKVTVAFGLNRDGSLAGSPEIFAVTGGASTSMGQMLAGSATRAIKMCQPYTMPADKYAAWAGNKIEFDPTKQ